MTATYTTFFSFDALRESLARRAERRRIQRDLHTLSDESLEDIGLNRADVMTMMERR